MKKLILIALTLFVSINLTAQNLETIKTYHDPYYRTKIYEVFTVIKNTPTKQGSYKSYDETGALYEDYNMNRGLKHGVCKRYYTPMYAANFTSNPSAYMNKLFEVANYSNGELNGELKRYAYPENVQKPIYEAAYIKDVMIKEVQYYSNFRKKSVDQINGPCNEWSEDGKVIYEGYKKNGSRVGVWKWYYDNGKLKNETQYNDKSRVTKEQEYSLESKLLFESVRLDETNLIVKKYDVENGNIIQQWNQIGIINDEDVEEFYKHGEEIKYFIDGSIDYKAHYNKGDAEGDFLSFHNNGKEKMKYKYKQNQIDGDFIEYSETGGVILEGKYNNGKKIGLWNSYYSDGSTKEKNIVKIDGEYLYQYENGKPKTTGFIKDGKNDGKWEHFESNGDLFYYEVFENGIRKIVKYQYELDYEKQTKINDSLNHLIYKKYNDVLVLYQAKPSTNVFEEVRPKKPVLYNSFKFYYDNLNQTIKNLNSKISYSENKERSLLAKELEKELQEMNTLLDKMIELYPMKTKKTLEVQLRGDQKLSTIKKLILEYTESN